MTEPALTSPAPASRTDAAAPWDAVVLLQMGGPATLSEIRPFLEALFRDPDIIRLPFFMRPFQGLLARYIAKTRTPKVAPRYEAMGGGSPLQAITAQQATGLEALLGVPVVVAMRYTKPWAHQAIAKLRAEGARRVLLLPLYPHWSESTTGSSLRDFAREADAAGLAIETRYIRAWGEHDAYVALVATTCVEALARVRQVTDAPVHLVLSAHGLPERYIAEGDPYQDEVNASAARIAKHLGDKFASVSNGFQSGLGPVTWIGPETGSVLKGLAKNGVKAVVLCPLGFVSDHIETKYDMDTLFREEAARYGITVYERAESFNDRADFARLLETLANEKTETFEVKAWTN